MAETRAAMRFGHQHPGETHFGHLVPDGAVEAGFVMAVAETPVFGDRCRVGEEAVGAVADHLLVVGEGQGHRVLQFPPP